MKMFTKFKTLYSNHRIKGGIVAILIVVGAVSFFTNQTKEEVAKESSLPVVTVTTAEAVAGTNSVSLVGSVRAFTEAAVTNDRPGRVTGVAVTLGQTVPSGTIVATLENASERAAVLQAEGAYEAALAGAAQSGVGVTEATNSLRNAENALRNNLSGAYTTVNGTIQNTVDAFFTSPNNQVPGLRIDGRGQTIFLNSERVAYQTLLPEWQATLAGLSTNSLPSAVAESIRTVDRTIVLIDTFIGLFNNQGQSGRYTEAELQGFSTSFTAVRSSLIATRGVLQSGLTSLENAQEQLMRAEIASSGGTTSTADAQIKQALGALQSAQANFAKTILRTPIGGTVNSLNVRIGDYLGGQVEVARVANNSALEIITFVGDRELASLKVGSTVRINTLTDGVVTAVAPAVDSATRKTEVRIATESTDIKNGDTVTITTNPDQVTLTTITIPITAVKFALEDGVVFTVVDNKLIARPVQVGVVRGGIVEITEGLSATDEFVLDARGLLEGTEVTVAR